MRNRVLLTGATGTIGGRLATRLVARDAVALRVLVRSPEKVPDLHAAGVEVIQGSFEDTASLQTAMDSVDTVVLITPFDPTAADQAHAAITAAQAANVRRIVRLSVILADPDGPTDSYRLHGRTDAEIQASNLTYTIVRPSTFMQNFGDLAATILSDPAIRIPFGDGRLGYIDARDVVDVFEQVIVSDTHDGQVLSLTGPASISLTEAARVFSQVLGREITHIPVPPAETENYFRAMGLDGWALTVLCDYCDAFRRNYQDIVTDGVERVTGHAARSLDNFIREEFVPMLQHNGSTTQEATPHLD